MRHSYNYIRNATMTRFGVPASDDRKRSKADGAPRRRHIEPVPQEGGGPEVPGRRILRSARPRAGEVRDAAPRVGRQPPGDAGHATSMASPGRRITRPRRDFDEAGHCRARAQEAGPRGPHKLHGDVLAFVESADSPGKPIRARELAKLIRKELGLEVHPRTIERACGAKKSATMTGASAAVDEAAAWARVTEQYETMRTAARGEALPPEARCGLSLFLRRGMWAWARAPRPPQARKPRPTRPPPPSPVIAVKSIEPSFTSSPAWR